MSLEDLLNTAKASFLRQNKNSTVKFQLAKYELPPTGLVLNNPLMEYMFDRRFMAFGRAYLLYGKKGNAKTSLMFDLFKLFQRAGGDAIWIETENAEDLRYARLQGVDVDSAHFTIQHPSTLEEGLNLVKTYIDVYSAKYPEGDGPPLIIGFDSIAGTMTEYEAENDKMGENKVGNHAKIMADFYRKIIEPLSTEKICFVALNQLRDKIGGAPAFGAEPGEAMLGGEAPRFHSTYQFKTVRTKDLVFPDKYGAERKIGSQHTVTVKRNKLGREGNSQKVDFDLYIAGGIDWFTPLVRLLGSVYTDVVNHQTKARVYWKLPNVPYTHIEYDESGTETKREQRMIPTDKAFREEELGVIISNSPAACDICRERFGIPEMPNEALVEEVAKDNKAKRVKRKKISEEEELGVKSVT